MDIGETFAQPAIREVKEDTGSISVLIA